jgi:hypothetical protein
MPDEGTGRQFGRLWLWGVFSLVTFLLDKQKKVTRLQGEKQCYVAPPANQ